MTKITVSDGQRVELLQAQNLRLSGMVHDMRKEIAVSDALLISEAEASLARLVRAEKAEAERDQLLKLLEAIIDEYNGHMYGPTMHAIEAARSELDKADGT